MIYQYEGKQKINLLYHILCHLFSLLKLWVTWHLWNFSFSIFILVFCIIKNPDLNNNSNKKKTRHEYRYTCHMMNFTLTSVGFTSIQEQHNYKLRIYTNPLFFKYRIFSSWIYTSIYKIYEMTLLILIIFGECMHKITTFGNSPTQLILIYDITYIKCTKLA